MTDGICYKLRRPDMTTHSGYKWTPGEWRGPLSGEGPLCGPGWFHAYDTPELAMLLNPIHANLLDYVVWQDEWGGKRLDDRGLKFGATEMRPIEIVEIARPTVKQRIYFGIRCALAVYSEPTFGEWAAKWIDGSDRAEAAAWAAEAAAWAAARAAEADRLPLALLAAEALGWSDPK